MTILASLSQAYVTRERREVITAADFTVRAGELVGVLGPNGAGKTTMLRALLGLQRLASGRALLGGDDPAELSPQALASRVAYLPQDRRLAWSLPAWRIAGLGAPDAPPALAKAKALAALARVGLEALADRGVLDMSGGERARVLLARLFVASAPLLIADEPAASLDPEAQLRIMELLREAAAGQAGVCVSLHDLTLAARYCDRVVVLKAGRIIADGSPADALSSKVLGEVFGLQGSLISTPAGLTLAARRN